jgi:signal peptidase I
MKKYFLGLFAILTLVLCLYIAVVFIFNRVMNVPTGGMANTIIPDELIVASRFYSEIKRGDIMVFNSPNEPNTPYIKRVIGMPGETILIRGVTVFINDQELPERRVFCLLNRSDDKASLKEIFALGSGNYSVYFDKNEIRDDASTHQMKFAIRGEPFKIPAGE